MLDENKKKKVASSITYTTGDPKINVDHFNKMLMGKEENTHTDGYMNGTIEAMSPDGSNSVSLDGCGLGEALDLDEGAMYVSKWNTTINIPDNIHILDRHDIESAIEKLEPEEEFEVGYVTPISFYSELDDKFSLVKCTTLTGYTGVDYIEARANDDENKAKRIEIAKQTAALGTDNGLHSDRQPGAHRESDFSAQYSQTNKTVKQHFDAKHSGYDKSNQFVAFDQEGRNYETILFYPKVGSTPEVIYYLDTFNGRGFKKVSRDQLEHIILERVAENSVELLFGVKKDGTPRKRRWDDAALSAKIRKQLASDAATINAVTLDKEDHFETRSRISNGANIAKPQVRALYTNQIYYIKTPYRTFGKKLVEELEENFDITFVDRKTANFTKESGQIMCDNSQGEAIADYLKQHKYNVEKVTNKNNKIIGVKYSKNSLKEEVELDEAKRYVRRYYIRPQNIFCSNKDEVLKALIDLDDANCSVYTLNNLIDNNDVTKLTNKDIIYYYDDGKLYDKNHVKVMDYDLAIKHEEKRDAIDPDKVSDKTFNDVYDDRMTDRTDLAYAKETTSNESLEEEFNLSFDSYNVYGERLVEGKEFGGICCICGEEIEGYGNNPEPYMSAENGERCCDACNMHFVIPARLEQINKEEK